jgi:hypothetical protein
VKDGRKNQNPREIFVYIIWSQLFVIQAGKFDSISNDAQSSVNFVAVTL